MMRANRRGFALIPAALAVLALAGLALVAMDSAQTAQGAPDQCDETRTVEDLGDDGGAQQLRAALANVCDGGTVDVIGGAVYLADGALVVERESVTLRAVPDPTGVAHLTIDAGGASAGIDVREGARLVLEHVTVTGGAGAGMTAAGPVTLTGTSAVTGNDGPGIHVVRPHVLDAPLRLQNHAQVSGNSGHGIHSHRADISLNGASRVAGNGGFGIFAELDSHVTLSAASHVWGNADGGIRNIQGLVDLSGDALVGGNGGHGVSLVRSAVTLHDFSRVSWNAGSGIYLEGYSNAILRDDSSVAANMTGGDGGGIYVGFESFVEVHDRAYLAANSAAGNGGGIYHGGLEVVLSGEVSVAGNRAGGQGGGVYVTHGKGSLPQLHLRDTASVAMNGAGASGGGVYLDAGALDAGASTAVSGNAPDDIVDAGAQPGDSH